MICSKFTTHFRTASALVGVALLAACASLTGTASPEKTVEKRANERWQHMVKRDFAAAYAYLPPSVRNLSSVDRFRGRFGVAAQWAGATVESVSCEPEKCVVRVRVDAKPALGPRFGDTITTYVDETWILEDGQWWLFQKI